MIKEFYHRDIIDKIMSWSTRQNRKPLILRGARQIGKTAGVRFFASEAKLNLCELNFERQPELKRAFSSTLDPRLILRELEVYSEQSIKSGTTLLFLDEIQECPEAIKSLRYFFEEIPGLHVIAAGSLLEFAFKETSVPVGRVEYEFMYPMSFSEFLKATKRTQLTAFLPRLGSVQKSSQSLAAPSDAAGLKLREALKEYFIVGGMPEAVREFVESGSFTNVAKIQDSLLQTFRDDIRKYTRGTLQVESVGDVFTRIFKFVGKQTKYTELGDGVESKRAKKSLHLLEQAMLVKIVRSTNASGLPLGAEANDKQFKCLFLDIGLGQRSAGFRVKDIFTTGNLLGTYKGLLAEQFVGQQLLAESIHASEDREIYCWIRSNRSSTAEVDYVIARDGDIVPIEIKSGKSGTLKSLQLYLAQFGGQGICLQDTSVITKENNIVFMPLYTIL